MSPFATALDDLKSRITAAVSSLNEDTLNRRDGVLVIASVSQSVDLGFIPKSSHTKRL